MQLDSHIPTLLFNTPISVLNLDARIERILYRARIDTIGKLVETRHNGLEIVKGIGEKSLDEIDNKLIKFIKENVSKSDQEIERIIDQRPSLILIPDNEEFNFVKTVPSFAKMLLTALGNSRDYEIIQKRFGLELHTSYTLQEIGDYYDLTRERVRQIKERGIRKIKEAILSSPEKFKWRIPSIISEKSLEIFETLNGENALLTETEIISLLEKKCSTHVSSQDIGSLRLLLNIYGFKSLPKHITGFSLELYPSWVLSEKIKIPILYQAIGVIQKILSSTAKPYSLFELTTSANKKRKNKLPPDYLKLAIKVCPNVEITEGGLCQSKFEYLSSHADRTYRVLYEAGQPLHFRDIWKEINHRLAKAGLPADVKITDSNGICGLSRNEA